MFKTTFLTVLLCALLLTGAAAQDATPEATAEPVSESTLEATSEPALEITAEATAESTLPPGAMTSFPGAGSYTVRQPYADVERSYRVHIPAGYSDDGDPFPLLLVLHGAGGEAAGTESFTGFSELAETENFIAVYPNGINNGWNDGRPGGTQVDDVRFLSDVVLFLSNSLTIDPLRVYATGFSMGGMMAYRLGCERPDVFAAVGSVASTMPVYLLPSCNNSPPVPVIVFQGTDDGVIPWTGVQGAYLSTAQTIGYWGNHNACSDDLTIEPMPDTVPPPDDFTLVVRQSPQQCAAEVVVYGIYFGGHTWPGRPFNAPQLGQTALDVDATALTWEFFSAHVNANAETASTDE